MNKIIIMLMTLFLFCIVINSQEMKDKKTSEQYVYKLKLIPRLMDQKNWTEEDLEIGKRHSDYVNKLYEEGKVILYGRTLDTSQPNHFGIVILEVNSEKEARKIMNEDNAVKEKIMTAELFPFRVAVVRK